MVNVCASAVPAEILAPPMRSRSAATLAIVARIALLILAGSQPSSMSVPFYIGVAGGGGRPVLYVHGDCPRGLGKEAACQGGLKSSRRSRHSRERGCDLIATATYLGHRHRESASLSALQKARSQAARIDPTLRNRHQNHVRPHRIGERQMLATGSATTERA